MQIKLFFTRVTMQSQPELELTRLEQKVNEWLKGLGKGKTKIKTSFVPSYILITASHEPEIE